MSTVMELEQVTKEYGMDTAKVMALDGIDLEIAAGEMLAITGASGSGKSTLLHILGMVDCPTNGSVKYDGMVMSQKSDEELSRFRNRTVGFVYQNFNLIPELTAEENILLPVLIAKAKEDTAYFNELLEALGITDRATHLPSQLSGGQQQRVAIARALIQKPQILLCDEPTGNLDTKSGEEVLELLKKVHDLYHTTVIVVTHDKHIASQMERQIVLQDGKIVSNV